MSFPDDRNRIDREILGIVPERFEADPDSRYARKTALIRTVLTVSLLVLAVAALGAATRYIFFTPKPKVQAETGVPLITADDKPIRIKPAPEDRGGMDVPDRDKLVYEKMGGSPESAPQSERLLPPPEIPAPPPVQQPRPPSIKPAFQPPSPKDADTAGPVPEQSGEAPASPSPPATVAAPAQAQTQPAPAPVPAKAAAVKRSGGGWRVQLGALKSESDAKAEWGHILSSNKDVLGGLSSKIARVDLGAKGIYWRVYAGPMDEAAARTVCAQLSKRNQGCIVGKE